MTTLKYLTLTNRRKETGVYINGNKQNGEYKKWWSNKTIMVHYFYKNGLMHGERKSYWDSGTLIIHLLYKEGNIIKDFLKEK